MRGLFLVCVLVGFAAAQLPTPCQSPAQWECREIRADRSKNFEERRKLTYDEINKRERKLEEIELGSTRNFYDILTLHNENVEYILDLKTRKCNKTALTRPWRPRGVIPGAHFDFEVTIGAAGVSGESMVVKSFSLNGTEGAYLGLVTSPDCIPVNNIFMSKENGLEQSTYYDVVVGNPDPMVFIPPSECMT